MIEGRLTKLAAAPTDPVRYTLRVGKDARQTIVLNDVLGRGIEFQFLDRITCQHCGTRTNKSYSEGYCYPCFKRLARCDLCVVSPDRCHYHLGTCREPDWGESFCMQPHHVYLANSAGPKVGITGTGNELGRWIDQGANQGLLMLAARTRRLAGIVEVSLTEHITDRTDWRRLVSQDAPRVELADYREELRTRLTQLPEGVSWLQNQTASILHYPVTRYGTRITRLRLDETPNVRGTLLGIKGQFLLFDHGVFNVRQHTSYHVRVTVMSEPLPTSQSEPVQGQLWDQEE